MSKRQIMVGGKLKTQVLKSGKWVDAPVVVVKKKKSPPKKER